MSVSKKPSKLFGLIVNQYRSISNHAPLLHVTSKNYKFPILSQAVHTSNCLLELVSYKLSDIGEGIREVVIKEWFVKVGDKVSQFDEICEVQSDKASVTITSRYDGIITKLHHNIEETALVGQPLVDIKTKDEGPSENIQKKVADSVPEEIIVKEIIPSYKQTLCIPSVRRMAKEHSVDLSQIKGSGKDGRILKEDVIRYLNLSKPKIADKPMIHQVEKIEPIRGFTKAMVKTMTDSLEIPHFVYSDEIVITKLAQVRNSVKKIAKEDGIKITYMPFFIKAISNALLRYPILNAAVDKDYKNIIYKSEHNIGFAMDTPVGLVVPIIKNVQKLSIIEIGKEMNRLTTTGKDGTFGINDLSGGTISVSNIGAIGGTYMKPVILPPQLAIISIGTSKVVPRFDDQKNVVAEEITYFSGAADHRIIDGATMAKFMNFLKRQIENPYLLFLNL